MTRMLLTLAVCLPATAASADPLTRAEVVSTAARKNPQVEAARATVAGARARKAEADAARWPELTVRLGVGPSLRAELVPGTAVSSTESVDDIELDDLSVVVGGRLEIIQPLYTFGKIGLRRRAAELGIHAERARAEMTAADVALEAATLYETHLFARDVQLFFEEITHTLDRSILDTRSRLERGDTAVSDQDLARLQNARAAAQLGLNQARAGVAQSAAGLRAYLALPAGASLEIADRSLAPVAASRESALERPGELIAAAMRQRPELVALRAGAAAFDSLAAAERAGWRPDFFIMGSVDGAYTPGRDFLDTRYVVDPLNHFVPRVIIGLNWSLKGATASARARQQRAEATRLEKLRSWAETALPTEVRVAMLDVQRARADIDQTATAVDNAKEWVVKASADYTVGLATSQDLADSVEAYATMRVAHLDAIRRLNIAMATLARATGSLIGDQLSLYPGGGRR